MNPAPVRRVLVTRPTAQSASLEQLLLRRGFEAHSLPLFRIEAHGDTDVQRQQLAMARDWNGWIFTSANAARAAAALASGRWPTLYAIGDATAASLLTLGHPDARRSSTGSTSEALLDHPDLLAVHGQRFLICTGAGGRDLLERELRNRGAHAERLELYRRAPVAHAAAYVRVAIQTCDAIICTSGESVERLHALTPEDVRAALHARLLVVPSARVLELARGLGWSAIRAPATTSDEAWVDCLIAAD